MEPLFVKNPLLAGRKVVIYGTDKMAILTFTVLLQNEVYVDCFCEREKRYSHLKIMNKPVKTLEELREEKEKIWIIVGGIDYLEEVEELEHEGFQVFYDFNLSSYEGNSVLIQGE